MTESQARNASERTESRRRARHDKTFDKMLLGDINISYPHFKSSDEEGEDDYSGDYYGHGNCGC